MEKHRVPIHWFWVTGVIVAIIIGVNVWLNRRGFLDEELKRAGNQAQELFWVALVKEIGQAEKSLVEIATELADDPEVRRLMTEGNKALEKPGLLGEAQAEVVRKKFQEMLIAKWGRIAGRLNVKHLHFYLGPTGVAFLRLPDTSRFGDAVKGQLHVVSECLDTGMPQSGFESGPVFTGIRAVAPVAVRDDQGKTAILGAVEAGVGLDGFALDLRDVFKVESGLLLAEGPMTQTSGPAPSGSDSKRPWSPAFHLVFQTSDQMAELYSKKPVRVAIAESITRDLLSEGPQSKVVPLDGRPVMAFFSPVRDYQGGRDLSRMPVGVMVSWVQVPDYMSIARKIIRNGFLVWLVGLASIMTALYFTWRMASRRLTRLIEERTRQLRSVDQERTVAEERYGKIFENALQGMFQCTLNGQFVSVNPAMARILGYDAPEKLLAVRDMASRFYFKPQEHQAWVEALKEKGELRNREVLFMHKNGLPVWALINARLTTGPDQIPLIEGLLLDHTARKLAEEELQESRQRLRRIIETTSEGFLMMDGNLKVMDVNSAMLSYLGASRDSVIGQKTEKIFGRVGRSCYEKYKNALEQEEHVDLEIEFTAPDGRQVPFLIKRSKLRDESDRVVGYIAFLTDLSDLKKAQAEVKKAEERYRGFFENAAQGMFLVRPEGRLVAVNHALVKMLGYGSPEEILDLPDPVDRVLGGEGEWQPWVDRLRREGQLADILLRLKHRDGAWVSVTGFLRLSEDESGRPMVAGCLVERPALDGR